MTNAPFGPGMQASISRLTLVRAPIEMAAGMSLLALLLASAAIGINGLIKYPPYTIGETAGRSWPYGRRVASSATRIPPG